MNAKALILGSIVSVSLVIGSQLVFVLIASYIGIAAGDNVFIKENKELMWFVIGISAYAISLLFGGMITAALADKQKIVTAALVGLTVALLSVLTSGDLSELNYKAIVMVVAGTAFSAMGAWITGEKSKDGR